MFNAGLKLKERQHPDPVDVRMPRRCDHGMNGSEERKYDDARYLSIHRSSLAPGYKG